MKKISGIEVTLSPAELVQAAEYAEIRQTRSEEAGKRNKHGLVAGRARSLDLHLQGIVAEMSAAKAIGVEYVFTVNTFKKADLGEYTQVKGRTRHDYELLVRPDDDPQHLFICVTGIAPTLYVRGWLWGHEAMQLEYRQTHGGRPPAYFVPHKKLHPMETFWERPECNS